MADSEDFLILAQVREIAVTPAEKGLLFYKMRGKLYPIRGDLFEIFSRIVGDKEHQLVLAVKKNEKNLEPI